MPKEQLSVFKIGGAVLEDATMRANFINGFAAIPGKKILIHGGGRTASALSERLGIETKMIEGRRVTDDDTIDIVTMVYGGLVNKRLIASLQAKGLNALGLTGADGNLITSMKRPKTDGVDYGWVGDPIAVNAPLLYSLVEQGVVPVLAPLTHDGAGNLYNTNADTIASTVAVALTEMYDVDLIMTFEMEGVMLDLNDPNSLLKEIRFSDYQSMKESGKIHGGMLPKLENAFKAIQDGVKVVRICKFDQINTDNGSFLQI